MVGGAGTLCLPPTLQLIIGIPAILGAFGAVLWTKGFGPEDRELFRLRKDEVAELREAEAAAEARDQVEDDRLPESVAEVAHAGEQHGQAGLVGRGDHLVVADRAAGLDDRGRAGLGGGEQAVGEGEEGVRGDRRSDRARLGPAVGFGRFARLDRGDPGAVAAVHLARADAGGDAIPGIDDGVRLDVLGDGPGEQAVVELLLGRLAFGDDLELVARDDAVVAVLDQEPAGDDRDGLAGARRIGQLAGQKQAQVLLFREDGARRRRRRLARRRLR